MGTLTALSPLLGLLAGVIVARLAKSELKDGKKYFIILQHALLAGIAAALLWQYRIAAIVIAVVLFLILWKKKFAHPLELTPCLAVPAMIVQVPIFLYFIPTGTLHWKETKNLVSVALVYAIIGIFSTLTI